MILCVISVFSIIQGFVLTYPLKLHSELRDSARPKIYEDLEMIKLEQIHRNLDFKKREVKRLNR